MFRPKVQGRTLLPNFIHLKHLNEEARGAVRCVSHAFSPCLQLQTLEVKGSEIFKQLVGASIAKGCLSSLHRPRFTVDSTDSLEVVGAFLRQLTMYMQEETSIGLYVKCLRDEGLEITVQIDDSESYGNFISQCKELLLHVDIHVELLVVFALGRFKWAPNFQRSAVNDGVLSLVVEICDEPHGNPERMLDEGVHS